MSDYLKQPKPKTFGGIRAKNLEQNYAGFVCAFCFLLLYPPYQLHCCGTLVCQWCFLHGLADQHPFTCPYCTEKRAKKEASFDRAKDRELKAVALQCFACDWNGSYKDYLNHLESKHCDFSCTDCSERFFSRNSYEQHRKESCLHRSLPCELPGCEISIKWYDMTGHYLTPRHQHLLQNLTSKALHSRSRKERRRLRNREYRNISEIHQISHSSYEMVQKDLARVKTDLSQLKATVEENVSQIAQLKTNQKQSAEELQELNANLTKMQSTIDRVKQTQKETKISFLDSNSSTILSFDTSSTAPSATVQTSNYGYLFEICLSTAITDNQEYLAMTLTLLNGDYYNLLPFPFTHDIHMVLWDQSNQKEHILRVIKPASRPEAFIRPKSDKNEDYQIADFCLLKNSVDPTNRYVKDGLLFIGIFVDFLNLGQNPFRTANDDVTAMNTN